MSIRIFDFANYKDFVTARLRAMPKRGHGQWQKIAQHLRVHTTHISQIFRGHLHLSLEHAQMLGTYLGLSHIELDYLILSVQKERAGTSELKSYFAKQMENCRERSKDLGQRLQYEKELDAKAQALFYSQWYFSAIRLLCSIPGFDSAEKIAEHLRVPLSRVRPALDFLLEHRLCVENDGRLAMGPARTFVGRESPVFSLHHGNWRRIANRRVEFADRNEVLLTSPVSISRADFSEIRDELNALIEKIQKTVKDSPAEELACLNIDWFLV